MTQTKHDLSANIATINLTELKSALLFGGRHAQTACERAMGELHNSRTLRQRMYAAQNLQAAAIALEKISISLYYLDEAKSRAKITVDKGE